MHWNLVDKSFLRENEIQLYQKNSEFMIRVGGLELMNSLKFESELEMAYIAKKLFDFELENILIGGLGIGYTFKSFIEEFKDSKITVIEYSESVIKWFNQYFQKKLELNISPKNHQIIHQDISIFLRNSNNSKFDLIILDVDNGPVAISTSSNNWLYSEEGIEKTFGLITPQGYLFVWSSFKSLEFQEILNKLQLKFSVQEIKISDRISHFIYLITRSDSSGTILPS